MHREKPHKLLQVGVTPTPATNFKLLPWSNTSGIRLLNGTMQVGILPAAPLPGGVKVARRPVKPFGVGASPTLAAILENRIGIAEVGALPTPSANLTINQRKSHETRSPLPKPIALSQELQTESRHANTATAAAEPRVPPREPVWREAAINHRLVAQ